MKTNILMVFLFLTSIYSNIEYVELFFYDGTKKAEGWVSGDKKVNYWYHYYSSGSIESKGNYKKNLKEEYWFYFDENGALKKEGHYEKGTPTSWWRYYKGDSIMIVELTKGRKEGLAVYRINGKPVKAEFYKNDIKSHEWFTLKQFKQGISNLD